jgi:hypothetical protein
MLGIILLIDSRRIRNSLIALKSWNKLIKTYSRTGKTREMGMERQQ